MTTARPAIRIDGLGQAVTAEEAAEILSLTRQRIHQLVDEERIAGAQIGATMFVSLRAVRRYARERKRGWPKGKPRKPRPRRQLRAREKSSADAE